MDTNGTSRNYDLFEFKENAVIEINGEKATAIMTEVSGNATQFLLKKGEAKIQQFTCSTDDPFKNDGAIVNTNTSEPTASSQTSTLDANPKAIDKLLNQTKIIGNFVQSSGGTLAMNISSASNSKLVVNGNATVGGNLNVTKSANKVFALNDSFDLIKANNITGTFSKVTLPELASGLQWDTSSLYSDGSVKVTTSSTSTTASGIYTYPNPILKTNPTAYITYTLQSASNITIEIYDIYGHRVHSASMTSGQTGAVSGANKYTIPTNIINDMSRSVYFAIIHNGSQTLGKTKFAVK